MNKTTDSHSHRKMSQNGNENGKDTIKHKNKTTNEKVKENFLTESLIIWFGKSVMHTYTDTHTHDHSLAYEKRTFAILSNLPAAVFVFVHVTVTVMLLHLRLFQALFFFQFWFCLAEHFYFPSFYHLVYAYCVCLLGSILNWWQKLYGAVWRDRMKWCGMIWDLPIHGGYSVTSHVLSFICWFLNQFRTFLWSKLYFFFFWFFGINPHKVAKRFYVWKFIIQFYWENKNKYRKKQKKVMTAVNLPSSEFLVEYCFMHFDDSKCYSNHSLIGEWSKGDSLNKKHF